MVLHKSMRIAGCHGETSGGLNNLPKMISFEISLGIDAVHEDVLLITGNHRRLERKLLC